MAFGSKKSRVAPCSLKLAVDARLQSAKVTCPKCKKEYTGQEAFDRLYVCPECGDVCSECSSDICGNCGKCSDHVWICPDCGESKDEFIES